MADEKKKKKEKDKTKKKRGKAGEGGELSEEEEEESVGSKIVLFLVTLIIILVWLAIFGILIKFDVGGFGSTVLYPVLKDVPVVNKILPEVTVSTEEDSMYDTLDSAIARIKELEIENGELSQNNADLLSQIDELMNQISDLSTYKEEQANFEKIKEKFYEEVVFSDAAPDISVYRAYYESIDPENAAVLYKQVVEQEQLDAKLQDYVKTYSAMKAKDAAAIFDTMTDDLALVAKILKNMSTQSRADILAAMKEENAAKVTQMLEP